MTSKLKILVTSTVATVAIMGSNPAFAADLGTDAGTSITNTVTVNYNVGGTAQTTENDSDTFVVDRKVNLLVAASDALNTTVAPDEDGAAVTFDVTNLTNDTIDILLTSERYQNCPMTNSSNDQTKNTQQTKITQQTSVITSAQ